MRSKLLFPSVVLRHGGAAYIEFVLCLGVVLSILVASIDLGSLLDTRSRMSVLTREIGNDTFKEWFKMLQNTPPPSAGDVKNRLHEIRRRSFQFAHEMGLAKQPLADVIDPSISPTNIPRDANMEIIISLYECDDYSCTGDCSPSSNSTTCSCQCVDPKLVDRVPNNDPALEHLFEFKTEYKEDIVEDEMLDTMHRQERIVISEVVLRYQGITDLTDQKVIYEESIF